MAMLFLLFAAALFSTASAWTILDEQRAQVTFDEGGLSELLQRFPGLVVDRVYGPAAATATRAAVYLAGEADLAALQEAGYAVTLLDDRHQRMAEQRATVGGRRAARADGEGDADPLTSWESYHSHDELVAFLQAVHQRYAAITNLFSIGKSREGRDLWMMEISRNPGVNEAEPELKVMANIHGDEVVGRENALRFILHLCEGYGRDAELTALVDTTAVFVLPCINPDGFQRHARFNAAGVDLNRNFPDAYVPTPGVESDAQRQPETRALMAWMQQHHFVLSMSLHGGALVANYPYDGVPSGQASEGVPNPAPDDAAFRMLAHCYADAHQNMSRSREFPDGIVQGSVWYSLYGGVQDWSLRALGTFELTLELADTKWPSPALLPHLWDQNRPAMVALLQCGLRGVRGTVRSAATGLPLAASIFVKQIDSAVRTDPAHGDYYRILPPGTYEISALVPMLEPQFVEVTVPEDGFVVVNFEL